MTDPRHREWIERARTLAAEEGHADDWQAIAIVLASYLTIAEKHISGGFVRWPETVPHKDADPHTMPPAL